MKHEVTPAAHGLVSPGVSATFCASSVMRGPPKRNPLSESLRSYDTLTPLLLPNAFGMSMNRLKLFTFSVLFSVQRRFGSVQLSYVPGVHGGTFSVQDGLAFCDAWLLL